MDLVARPTTYRGARMRSRLEAAFAAFLDRSRYFWEYEPRAFGGATGQYLPDFGLPFVDGDWAYIEVKPKTIDPGGVRAALTRMEIIWESEPKALLILACPWVTVVEINRDHGYIAKWAVCRSCGGCGWLNVDALPYGWCRWCEGIPEPAAFVDPFSPQFWRGN